MKNLRSLLPALLALTLLAANGPTFAQMAPYLHAQLLVDVAGRRMNVYCVGSGDPTVVLDAGLAGSTEVWYKVQPRVAQHTRVCSYDRAGMGFSDPAATVRDPNAVVTDLHTLLHRAGISPPYVLVGHSIAGLYEPLFADRYPREVAGMVLVDPARPFQVQRASRVAPAIAKFMTQQPLFFSRCYALLKRSKMTSGERASCGFSTPEQHRATCAKDGAGYCALDRVQDTQWLRPLSWYDALSEIQSIYQGERGSRQVQNAQRFYGAMPLTVLTADDGPHHDGGQPAGMPKAQVVAWWYTWKRMHDELARSSSLGVNYVVENSGHYIQRDRPGAVISAIDKVVDRVRFRK